MDVDVILAINCGSSSLKFALFSGDVETRRGQAATIEEVIGQLDRPDAVGHRIVHGGPDRFAPALVDAALLADLHDAISFAPLHLPIELAAIAAVAKRWPNIRQVVCFDTAFHRTLPPVAYRFALPDALFDAGVRRYGFHGLSYEYIASVVPPTKRAVFAHLGSGASMVAVRDGVAIDTTMGMTPSGGLVMGTRCGDLDPGVMLYLAAHGYDARSLAKLVDRESGLLALAGSADMQHLIETRATDPRAALAIDIFCYHAVKALGGLVAVLGGIDQLVFTGGIGEHAAPVRESICAALGYLGAFDIRVIATDEEAMIARHTRALS